jgi:hypothetical protein
LTHRRGSLGLVLAMSVCAFVAHRSHRSLDEIRYQEGAWDSERMRPNGHALRTAAMGYHLMLSDMLWVRTTLVAADIYDSPDPEKVTWLRESLEAMTVLDPTWRTLYFYGGAFLQVTDDIAGSNQIFELGMKNLPEDPYFPFSRGMNSYLYPDPEDPERSKAEAAEYLTLAADLPGAPGWYMGTAAIYMDEASQRGRAIQYLEEQLEAETRPRAQEILYERWAELKHDELAEQLEEVRQRYESEPPGTFQPPQFEQLLLDTPDPLEGQWIIGPDDKLRSSVREEKLAEKARMHDRGYLTMEAKKAWRGPR